jgi:hypothetical protein
MSANLNQFYNSYDISVLDTSKKSVSYSVPKNFTIPNNKDVVAISKSDYQTEPLYTVTIPESKLKQLAEMDRMFFNNRNDRHYRDMFATLMSQKQEEKLCREQCAAVKEAFEHYSMLLNLVKNGNSLRD